MQIIVVNDHPAVAQKLQKHDELLAAEQAASRKKFGLGVQVPANAVKTAAPAARKPLPPPLPVPDVPAPSATESPKLRRGIQYDH